MGWTMDPRKSELIAFAIKRYKLLLIIMVVAVIVTPVLVYKFGYDIPEGERPSGTAEENRGVRVPPNFFFLSRQGNHRRDLRRGARGGGKRSHIY